MGKKLAGTNEFAFFAVEAYVLGVQNQAQKQFEKCMPSGRYENLLFQLEVPQREAKKESNRNKVPCPSFPCFLGFNSFFLFSLRRSPCLFFLSIFPSCPRILRQRILGVPGWINNPCFWGVFPCLYPAKIQQVLNSRSSSLPPLEHGTSENGSCAAVFGKLRRRSCTAPFAFLQCGRHFYQKLVCNKRKTALQH